MNTNKSSILTYNCQSVWLNKTENLKNLDFFCPFCGVNSFQEKYVNKFDEQELSSYEVGVHGVKPCRHLTYIYTYYDDLVFIRSDLEKKIDFTYPKLVEQQLVNIRGKKDNFFCFNIYSKNSRNSITIGYEYK